MYKSLGIIGSGPVGIAIGRHAASHGVEVTVTHSRGAEGLTSVVEQIGGATRAGTVQEARSQEAVLLAIPFNRIPELAELYPDWSSQVVIDATNQFAHSDPYEGRYPIGDLTGSEWVSQRLAGATIVKAFNAMVSDFIAPNPRHSEGRQVVFYSGDDLDSKKTFGSFVERVGFAGIDLGTLKEGGRLMQLDGPLSAKHLLLME